jgi:hypothetical protein
MGSTALEAARVDMYHASWTDMMAMFMWKVWRAPDEESKLRGAADFWTEFPKFLSKHDSILANSSMLGGGPYYLGAKVRYSVSVGVLDPDQIEYEAIAARCLRIHLD